MSFADISKKLANEWSQLSSDEKTRYHERAELVRFHLSFIHSVEKLEIFSHFHRKINS